MYFWTKGKAQYWHNGEYLERRYKDGTVVRDRTMLEYKLAAAVGLTLAGLAIFAFRNPQAVQDLQVIADVFDRIKPVLLPIAGIAGMKKLQRIEDGKRNAARKEAAPANV